MFRQRSEWPHYEDLLQVCLLYITSFGELTVSIAVCNTVFEGLFPLSFEKVILDLLLLGTWDTLAKLRMHSTSSHSLFEQVIKTLGRIIRRFHNYVCPKYYTKDTPTVVANR